jgi:hypothetical protein
VSPRDLIGIADREATIVIHVVLAFVGLALAMFLIGRCSLEPAPVAWSSEVLDLTDYDAMRQQLEADGMECHDAETGGFWCVYPEPNGSEVSL